MGVERSRGWAEIKNMDEISVPPGFVSLTSFTLKRVDKSEETHSSLAVGEEVEAENNQPDASPYIVDVAKLKRSIKHRPWILHHQLDHFPMEYDSPFDVSAPLRAFLPKGVIRGCPSCENCQKVMASWHPEESRMPILEEVPVFHPTYEEFKDALNYVSSIRPKAEIYGLCRIVPPASWQPPCTLKEKNMWESSRFITCVQRINELQNNYSKSEYYGDHASGRWKRRKVLKSLEYESCEGPTTDGNEDGSNDESLRFERGPEFTLDSFKKYADDFQKQYFGKKEEVADSSCSKSLISELEEPSTMDVEGEYWRIIEIPSDKIEVLSAIDLDSRLIGSGFPLKSNSVEVPDYHEYFKSDWNLNNIPRLPGSLLSFESCETSPTLFPRLSVGMCFSSFCWNVEEHHLYSLCYSHIGAPRIWYSIPGKYRSKFEEVVKRLYPQLSEHPELLHKLVTQLSPSTLMSEGVPVYRCFQHPREFVLVFPGAYHSEFSCGFNCSEAVNFAPLDWLPHGRDIVELYSEHRRKTSLSYDQILLGAAMKAMRARWELSSVEDKSSDNERWGSTSTCGKDSALATALKSRIKQESRRREYLCNSSPSRKMEYDFDATTKRECCICLYDLHLSAASCYCSPDKYTCLYHAKQLCSCPWNSRCFLFRYEINEMNILAEALEGNSTAIGRWAREKFGPLFKDAGGLPRHGLESSSMSALEQRTSNFIDLTSNGVCKDPRFKPKKRGLKGEPISVCNANPQAHKGKEVPIEAHDKSGRLTLDRNAAEVLSSDRVGVINLSDDED